MFIQFNQVKKIMRIFFILFFSIVTNLYAGTYFIEAEDAILTGVNVAKSQSGYSGTGYVTGFDNDGDNVEFVFEAEKGLYELTIGFATPYGEKGYDLYINGSKSTGKFVAANKFSEHAAGKISLNQGENSIKIGKGWGWYYLDYITLSSGTVEPPSKPLDGSQQKCRCSNSKFIFISRKFVR